jgi:hypothetical protein
MTADTFEEACARADDALQDKKAKPKTNTKTLQPVTLVDRD